MMDSVSLGTVQPAYISKYIHKMPSFFVGKPEGILLKLSCGSVQPGFHRDVL
jgi:hypothetical protein